MKTASLSLIGVFFWALAGYAAPLELKTVPAGAKWLVHLDVEAMRDSAVVEKAAERWTEDEGGQEHLAKARQEWGIDLREDFHSATLYNTGYAKHEGLRSLALLKRENAWQLVVEDARGAATAVWNRMPAFLPALPESAIDHAISNDPVVL